LRLSGASTRLRTLASATGARISRPTYRSPRMHVAAMIRAAPDDGAGEIGASLVGRSRPGSPIMGSWCLCRQDVEAVQCE
jgi:hypothetical protein